MTLGTVAITGAVEEPTIQSRVASNQCSLRISSRSSWQTAQLMPSRTINSTRLLASQSWRRHSQDILHAQQMIRRCRTNRGPVGECLGERLVELLPAIEDGLVKLLVGFGQSRNIFAPADRFPCPINKRQFLPIDARHLRERRSAMESADDSHRTSRTAISVREICSSRWPSLARRCSAISA